MHQHNHQPRQYRVKLGHTEVTVQAHSSAEAIDQARRQLVLEFPRLYDVINTLDIARFEISDAA